MSTPEEQIDDLDLEFQSFLGTDFGASVAAELGQETVYLIWMAGVRAQTTLDLRDIEQTILELTAKAE